MQIFVTRAIPDVSLRRLAEALPDAQVTVHPGPGLLTPDELVVAARGVDALVCTLTDRIDAALLEALTPPLRVVSTFAVGHENIDLEAARRLGVRVANTPGVLTAATAEVAVALLLDAARRVSEGDRFTRAGNFERWDPLAHRGQSVYGGTVGVVGAGRIGLRVASTLRRGFDCEVLVHSRSDPRESESGPEWAELGARFVSKQDLLAASDFVSLHCPLTSETRHWIDAAALDRMPAHAILVNTSRGAVIDEAALVRALRDGGIAGAGLDVFEEEPRLASGLADLENVVLAPHIGSATHRAREAMGRLCVDAVALELAGRAAPNRLV